MGKEMYIVLQDEQGRAVGHIHLTEGGSALYLRGSRSGKGVLVSETGEHWGLDTPCPFSPVGAVVAEGEKITCRGLAPGERLSLRELEELYRHPPVKEEPTEEPTPVVKPSAVPLPEPLSPIEEARAAAAVFARVAEEAGQVFQELEGSLPPAQATPRGGEKWMEDTQALLSGAAKKPPKKSEASSQVQNPFPHAFPGARLHRVWGGGVLEHLEGEWKQGGRKYRLTAVPGTPALRPPRHLPGFTRYVSTGQGGYWVKLSPLF